MAVLDVWNRALSIARARGRLVSLSEANPEQEVLAQWYPYVLRTAQAAAWWPGCKAQARLALISKREDEWADGQPETGYQFAYALPSNLLRPWHLSDYQPFSLSLNRAQNKLMLSTNAEDPILTYAVLQESVPLWVPLQEDATTFALASLITGPLTGKNILARENMQLANNALMSAQSASANDMGGETKPSVPWLAARGYHRTSPTRFLYPFGELFSDAQ